MYFVVIMAFALVLSDALPPHQALLPVFRPDAAHGLTTGLPLLATLAVVVAQLLLVTAAAGVSNRLVLARLDGTAPGHDRATGMYSLCQRVLLGIIVAALAVTMIFTPWAPLVRIGWRLGAIPLVGDLLVLGPFALSVLIVWSVLYRVELRIRNEASALAEPEDCGPATPATGEAAAALAASKKARRYAEPSLGAFLLDKCRHQILIVAVPMAMIVFVKYFIELIKEDINRVTVLPWGADALLGVVSASVLAITPLLLRYVWSTEPLPDGPLRDRFVRICGRIGLRYREILLWHTHGTAINAAVMGFFAPLRYILVSDALLESMNEEEIEAVFGHEAGHIRHWHLQFFVLFAIISMYVAGGAMFVLWYAGTRWRISVFYDPDVLQLVALTVLLAVWLFQFGWLSRRFERQADLYGIRCVTPDIKSCVEWCPVHGSGDVPSAIDIDRQPSAVHPTRGVSSGLCVSAANLFGRTLGRIAELNGIPKDAPTWRHGSIEDRCRLIERLAGDPAALRRFDRGIVWIKVGLVAAALIGTVAAGLIYGEQIWHAVHIWFRR